MDPDATLAEMLDAARAVQANIDSLVQPETTIDTGAPGELAEGVIAMHGWLSGGGFLPAAWKPGQAEPGAINKALVAGAQAADILEAEPKDLAGGYDSDEVAQQFAAADRLVEAFRTLHKELTPR